MAPEFEQLITDIKAAGWEVESSRVFRSCTLRDPKQNVIQFTSFSEDQAISMAYKYWSMVVSVERLQKNAKIPVPPHLDTFSAAYRILHENVTRVDAPVPYPGIPKPLLPDRNVTLDPGYMETDG